MNFEDFLSVFTNDKTLTIAVLALIAAVISGLIGFWIGKKQSKATEESLDIQKRQYYFGRRFTKGKRITDGWTGPQESGSSHEKCSLLFWA